MQNYWVVGATVQGKDMTNHFVGGGFWFGDKDTAQAIIAKIAIGDRLFLKKGFAVTDIEIKAFGIVTEVKIFGTPILNLSFMSVDWIDLRKQNKTVPSHGMFGTIEGPYRKDHEYIIDMMAILS